MKRHGLVLWLLLLKGIVEQRHSLKCRRTCISNPFDKRRCIRWVYAKCRWSSCTTQTYSCNYCHSFYCGYQEISVSYKNPALYVALGELKGGIDPAGADEHWKTASTSLSRIRDVFTSRGLSPKLFFVGAAIENSMSEEIWNQLENSTLGNAANLTDANQVASLCRWLCNL